MAAAVAYSVTAVAERRQGWMWNVEMMWEQGLLWMMDLVVLCFHSHVVWNPVERKQKN